MSAKADPTKSPDFQRTLKNLLSTPHKPQSELKVGKGKTKEKKVLGVNRGDGGTAKTG